jgi:PAS domain S-box-containing protein
MAIEPIPGKTDGLKSHSAPIIERAPLPIVEVQGGSHIVSYVNSAFCALLGKARAELLGLPFAEIVPGGNECVPILDRVYQTGETVTHAHGVDDEPSPAYWLYAIWPALDASERPVGVIVQLTKAANFRLNIASVNEALLISGLRQHELAETAEKLNAKLQAEITERKLAEEALLESAKRFRFLAESMPQKIFTAKPNGEIDYFNQQWMEFTGLSFEQIRAWGWTQIVHPDDVKENVRLWKHAVETGERFHMEHRFRRKDGVYRWHLGRAQAKRDADGKVLMWVGSSTDVDDMKQLLENLSSADRRKDEFLAMLAHELRNPLVPIKTAAQIISMAGTSDPVIRQAREMIERQADRMTKLVDDLLDVARIEQGKVKLQKEHMDLAKAVSNAVESSSHLIKSRNHQIILDVRSVPPLHVDADPVRVEQILGNLVINASKYTPPNGIIHVSASHEQGMAVVRVRDNGIGIEPHMLQRIFEVFTQVEKSLDRTQGGLGLGLKLVKDLIALHGGTVEARSEGLNFGSEFIVRFPALSAADSQLITAVNDVRVISTPRRILVVDDNDDIIQAMSLILTMSGHSVELANDGEQGVEKAIQMHPDVALIDIGLPKIDGYEVARRIRSSPGGNSIVLLALTGNGQDEDKRKAFEAGFDEHLTKPVDANDLNKFLNEIEKYQSISQG